jgi:hypothetical protein
METPMATTSIKVELTPPELKDLIARGLKPEFPKADITTLDINRNQQTGKWEITFVSVSD